MTRSVRGASGFSSRGGEEGFRLVIRLTHGHLVGIHGYHLRRTARGVRVG